MALHVLHLSPREVTALMRQAADGVRGQALRWRNRMGTHMGTCRDAWKASLRQGATKLSNLPAEH